jgi:hypothetical protein
MKFLVQIQFNSGETDYKQLRAENKSAAKKTAQELVGNTGKVINVVKMN